MGSPGSPGRPFLDSLYSLPSLFQDSSRTLPGQTPSEVPEGKEGVPQKFQRSPSEVEGALEEGGPKERGSPGRGSSVLEEGVPVWREGGRGGSPGSPRGEPRGADRGCPWSFPGRPLPGGRCLGPHAEWRGGVPVPMPKLASRGPLSAPRRTSPRPPSRAWGHYIRHGDLDNSSWRPRTFVMGTEALGEAARAVQGPPGGLSLSQRPATCWPLAEGSNSPAARHENFFRASSFPPSSARRGSGGSPKRKSRQKKKKKKKKEEKGGGSGRPRPPGRDPQAER